MNGAWHAHTGTDGREGPYGVEIVSKPYVCVCVCLSECMQACTCVNLHDLEHNMCTCVSCAAARKCVEMKLLICVKRESLFGGVGENALRFNSTTGQTDPQREQQKKGQVHDIANVSRWAAVNRHTWSTNVAQQCTKTHKSTTWRGAWPSGVGEGCWRAKQKSGCSPTSWCK